MATAPAHKTVMIFVTVDGESLVVSAPKSGPRILHTDTAAAQLRDLVMDPSIPAAKTESAGFDMTDFMRGLGRSIAELGRDDPKAGA